MTDDDKTALARRAVACAGWRWMPGMLALAGAPVSQWRRKRLTGPTPSGMVRDPLPDLDDPATQGCFIALVREAHSRPGAYTEPIMDGHGDVDGWEVWSGTGDLLARQRKTEAEALVAALEAAPS